MLGLMCLGLTAMMIYTLVKNALLGRQLSKSDQYNGSIELIIPVTAKSDFFLEAWQNALSSYRMGQTQLSIHVLIDGHHPSLNAWEQLKSKIPYLQIHSFPMRPSHVDAVPWMLDQISSQIQGSVVIIGDSELVPSEYAFMSTAKNVMEQGRAYFVVPQTARLNTLGEAVSALNPTLAFTSFFGVKRWRRNLTHPLLNISQGWLAMPLKTYQELDFKSVRISTWKEAISRQWDEQRKTYYLAFGEKQLLRYYPDDLKTLIYQMKDRWEELWTRKDKMGFWLYAVALFLWSFPVVCFLTHPFWSLASIVLLCMYRFFSKIVFQESWRAIILHPIACVVWLGTLAWWMAGSLRSRFGSQASYNP